MNNCKLYLAPMEEVTTYVFRQVLDECFGGVDKYYTPFISPDQNKILKTRMGRELDPEQTRCILKIFLRLLVTLDTKKLILI